MVNMHIDGCEYALISIHFQHIDGMCDRCLSIQMGRLLSVIAGWRGQLGGEDKIVVCRV